MFLEWVALYFINRDGIFGEHELYAKDTGQNIYDDLYTLMGYGQQYSEILNIPTEIRIAFAAARRKEKEALLSVMVGKQVENNLIGNL